jgi:hypothetical protein
MKKILIIILMLSYPKILPAQTIKGTLLDLGNLAVVPNSDSVVNPPSEPVVLEEPNAGDFLVIDQSYTGADTRWTVNFSNILNKFYETYSDPNYDFIVLFPTKPMVSNWSVPLNRHIDGIGGGYGTYPPAPNLNALIALDFFSIWANGATALDSVLLKMVLIHEIGHYWLVNIQWPQHVAIGHWQNNLDLFSGDTRYIDPMAYNHWVIKNGQEFCVDGSATSKFSDLSLYIMGFLSPDQVAPIYEHVFELKPGNDYYNMWGPACGDDHHFIETRTITIQDIINTNGIRNPSYEQSQKDFRIAFIIVTAKGEAVPSGFIDYVKKYRDALPKAWFNLTSGKSTIGYLEVPQIVFTKADINFGQVIAKSVKIDTLTVTNNSSTPLLIDSIYTNTKWFTATSRKITLTQTDTLKLTVSFTPDTLRTYSDTLYIVNNSDTPLAKILLNGNGALTEVNQNRSRIPNSFGISQNYPNPFNPSTTINFQLPLKCHVTLKVFDVLGKEVAVLINTYKTEGYYSSTFNAINLPSGVYFYRLQAGSFVQTKKLLFLK